MIKKTQKQPEQRNNLFNNPTIPQKEQYLRNFETDNNFLYAIINSATNIAIFSLDKNYCYTAFNERCCTEMKKVWHVDIKIGMNLLECIYIEELRLSAKHSIDRALAGESFTEVQYQPETDTYYELNWNPIFHDNEVVGITAFVQDITKQKHNEIQLNKLNRDFSMARNISQTVKGIHDPGEMMKEACRIVVEYGRLQMAWIGLVNDKANKVDIAASYSDLDNHYDTIDPDLKDSIRANGPPGNTINTGKQCISNNIMLDDNMILWRDYALKYGYKSFASFPLIVREKVIGTFNLYSNETEFFRKEDIKLFDEMTMDISFAIEAIDNEARRKRIQEELHQSNELLQAIIKAAPIAIFDLDLDGYVKSIWNPAAEKLLGWNAKEAIGHFLPSIPEEGKEEFKRFRERIQRDETLTGEEVNRQKRDGSPIYYRVYASPIHNLGGKVSGNVAILEDITESKFTSKALQKSEEKYHSLVHKIQAAVIVHGSNTEIVTCNNKAMELLGLTIDQLLGKTAIDPSWHFLREDNTIMPIEEYPVNLVMATGQELRNYIVGVHRPKNDNDIWGLVNADPVFDKANKIEQIIVTFIDITERKKLEEKLKESEKQVRHKLESILSPEADIGVLELSDIIDSKILQKIMDKFYRLTKFLNAILDLKGNVLVGIGWQDICTKFHRVNPVSCKLCTESDLELSRGIPPGKFKLYRCKNNMWDMATPIMIGDKHVGNIYFGQFFFDDDEVDYEIFRQQAHKYGFDEQEYLAALDRVPRLSKDTVETAMSFYSAFAEVIGTLSYRNLKLVYALEERKKVEQKLKLLDFALNNVFDEVFLVNEKSCFQYVNDESCRALGYSREELLTLKISDIDPDFPPERWPEHWKDIMEYGSLVFESRHKTRDGTIFPVEISANYFEYNEQGYNLALVRNISERKLAEEKIRKLNRDLEKRVVERTSQLEAANKELETFAYSVSHDLRAPLRAIDGFTRILIQEYYDKIDTQGKNYLERVCSSTQRMGQIIDDILNLSRISRSEMTIRKVDLSKMVSRIAEEYCESQPMRKVKFKIQENIIADGDARLLRIVLENLIANAWKFTSKHPVATIEFGTLQQDSKQVFFVRDDGAGFYMDYAQKLFGAFQRLHNSGDFPGTGIGLATVQRIIQRHLGSVWAEGEVEKGATFYFTLP